MAERLWRKQLVILVAIMVSLLSFLPILATTNVAADGTTYSLATAESSGYVSINMVGSAVAGSFTSVNLVTGSGVFFGKCIDITVTSLTATALNLELKAGQKLVSSEASVQDMVVTESYSYTLASGSVWQQTIYANCINMHEYAPEDNINYSLGSMTTGDLYDLAVYCEQHDAHDGAAQGAIWAETDSATADDLEAYGLTTASVTSANSIYTSVTGKNIEGVEGATTGIGDSSNSIFMWLIPILVLVVVVGGIIAFIMLRKKGNRAGQGQMGAYYPQNNPPYPPSQPGYQQNNQPYQQPYRPTYPQQYQQGQQGYQQRPPAPVPPSQPPAAPPQQPVQQPAQQPAQQVLDVVSFCPNCGMKTDGRSLSCPSCGWYLGRK